MKISHIFVFQVIPLMLYEALRYLTFNYYIAVPFHTAANSRIILMIMEETRSIDSIKEMEGQYKTNNNKSHFSSQPHYV